MPNRGWYNHSRRHAITSYGAYSTNNSIDNKQLLSKIIAYSKSKDYDISKASKVLHDYIYSVVLSNSPPSNHSKFYNELFSRLKKHQFNSLLYYVIVYNEPEHSPLYMRLITMHIYIMLLKMAIETKNLNALNRFFEYAFYDDYYYYPLTDDIIKQYIEVYNNDKNNQMQVSHTTISKMLFPYINKYPYVMIEIAFNMARLVYAPTKYAGDYDKILSLAEKILEGKLVPYENMDKAVINVDDDVVKKILFKRRENKISIMVRVNYRIDIVYKDINNKKKTETISIIEKVNI